MRRRGWTLCGAVALAISACVPAGEESDPRGALGVITVPSPGARGEPFVTTDGWTIHVDALVLRTRVHGAALESISSDALNARSYESGVYLFSASNVEAFAIPGLEAGPGEVGVGFEERIVDLQEPSSRAFDPAELRRVDAALAARFDVPSDDIAPGPPVDDPSTPDSDESAYVKHSLIGPSILLVARAEKAGRVVEIDFAFQGVALASFRGLPLRSRDAPVDVRANALETVPYEVVAESLFTRDESCAPGSPGVPVPVEAGPSSSIRSGLVFDDFASADADGDGALTAAELRAERPPACADALHQQVPSMATVLQIRSSRMLRVRP